MMIFYSNLHAAISIERVTAPHFNVDSNQPTTGPRAAYVGYKLKNSSLTDNALNLRVRLKIITSGYALAGGQNPIQEIPLLAPSESDVLYWFVTYPSSKTTSCTMRVIVNENGISKDSSQFVITNKSSISSNAGGQIANATVQSGANVGQIVSFTVTYSFGGVQTNETFNMQPAGNVDFNAAGFQLVNTIVDSSDVPGINVGDTDKLYYLAAGNNTGTGKKVKVKYYFQYRTTNDSTKAQPYAVQTSGTQIKYTDNYGYAINVSYPPSPTPINFAVTET
ncbi:MAG: hypothetical protein ACKVTZ_11270, partial [Bacteroidia bacterium]